MFIYKWLYEPILRLKARAVAKVPSDYATLIRPTGRVACHPPIFLTPDKPVRGAGRDWPNGLLAVLTDGIKVEP